MNQIIWTSCVTAGFKNKCLNETKATKKLGEARPLTEEEEVRECNRGAAESFKDRFDNVVFVHIKPFV